MYSLFNISFKKWIYNLRKKGSRTWEKEPAVNLLPGPSDGVGPGRDTSQSHPGEIITLLTAKAKDVGIRPSISKAMIKKYRVVGYHAPEAICCHRN